MTCAVVTLAVADRPPLPCSFPGLAEYEAAWRLWLATRRDGRLTGPELEAKQCAQMDYHGVDGC